MAQNWTLPFCWSNIGQRFGLCRFNVYQNVNDEWTNVGPTLSNCPRWTNVQIYIGPIGPMSWCWIETLPPSTNNSILSDKMTYTRPFEKIQTRFIWKFVLIAATKLQLFIDPKRCTTSDVKPINYWAEYRLRANWHQWRMISIPSRAVDIVSLNHGHTKPLYSAKPLYNGSDDNDNK